MLCLQSNAMEIQYTQEFKFPVKIINSENCSAFKSRFKKKKKEKTNKYCNVDGFKIVNVYLGFPYGRGCSKFPLLVHDVVLIELWRERVLPRLLETEPSISPLMVYSVVIDSLHLMFHIRFITFCVVFVCL